MVEFFLAASKNETR